MKAPTIRHATLAASCLLLAVTGAAHAQTSDELDTLPVTPLGSDAPQDFAELDLESLLDIPVTSVSRKSESLKQAAAAIYVIQGDEIRRLGIHTIPEALRLAPGLHVAQINAQDYGITARGLNRGVGSNKLEVLVDGRSIYTPLFSGVLWDQQFALMADIERIEVIRGPGGTLWGANAVNGVINVVTKPAKDTQGTLVHIAGGDSTRHLGAVRYGFAVGQAAQARVYAQSYRLDESLDADGNRAHDALRVVQSGFRTDYKIAAGNTLSLQGDVFDTESQESRDLATTIAGADLAGSWTLTNDSKHREWMLRGYWDQYNRDTPGVFGEKRNTQQLELLLRQGLGERHDVVSGLSYRRSSDDTATGRTVIFDPASRTLTTLGAFVQDEISLIPERWGLIVGTKIEHNDLSGNEVQPSIRSSFALSPQSTIWGAVSRAVRVPNRVDHDLAFDTGQSGDTSNTPFGQVPGAPEPSQQCQILPQNPGCPLLREIVNTLFPPIAGGIVGTGNPNFKSEEAIAYELGYRTALGESLSLDTAAFIHRYDKLQSNEADGRTGNGLKGSTQGVETLLRWQALSSLRLSLNATFLDTQLEARPGSGDTNTAATADNDPSYYAGLAVGCDVSATTSFDAHLRSVGGLSNLDSPAYTELNLAGSWAPRPWLRLRLAGQNLLHKSHREFGSHRIERAVEAQAELRW